jgi:hypothetical protein
MRRSQKKRLFYAKLLFVMVWSAHLSLSAEGEELLKMEPELSWEEFRQEHENKATKVKEFIFLRRWFKESDSRLSKRKYTLLLINYSRNNLLNGELGQYLDERSGLGGELEAHVRDYAKVVLKKREYTLPDYYRDVYKHRLLVWLLHYDTGADTLQANKDERLLIKLGNDYDDL